MKKGYTAILVFPESAPCQERIPPAGAVPWLIPSRLWSGEPAAGLFSTDDLTRRVELKLPDRPTASAPPICPRPSGQDEESVLRNLSRKGQTVQTFLPASNTLSSLRSVTPTPRGLVCRKSPSASFSVAFGRCIRPSPPATRSFAASGLSDRRHSRFASTAYGPHTGHFSVQCLALHHPEQGRQLCFLSWQINYLELRTVFLALVHFLPLQRCHVLVRTDNMAVVSHIKRQGGSQSHTLDRLARVFSFGLRTSSSP